MRFRGLCAIISLFQKGDERVNTEPFGIGERGFLFSSYLNLCRGEESSSLKIKEFPSSSNMYFCL